jgi:phospholipase C
MQNLGNTGVKGSTGVTHQPPPPPSSPPVGASPIKHIFVLMMENRSYDHFLGFSGITGTDTQTGQPTTAEGLTGGEANCYTIQTGTTVVIPGQPKTGPPATSHPQGVMKLKPIGQPTGPGLPQQVPTYTTYKFAVSPTAGDITDWQGNPTAENPGLDPEHQFPDVMVQLCDLPPLAASAGLNGGSYPPVTNAGFAACYARKDAGNPGEVMLCFSKENLPVLNALANEFVLCDHWFSSMAGPTEPNRMFAHAATSGVWDDSPSTADYAAIYGVKTLSLAAGRDFGIPFANGTIFNRLRDANKPFRIYAGDSQPQVGLLAGISLYFDVDDFANFLEDVNDPGYDAVYTFIEPRYDTLSEQVGADFVNNSQHSSNSVTLGEQLIKNVYEAIRYSPHWNESMLIITWDEHGGFYDHVPPPRATPTGSKGQKYGFMFDQYGPRVPAVVISPWCPKNMIEHRQLEHSVIPATIEQVFGLQPLTVRDGALTGLQSLATLATPRVVPELTLTPVTAPNPTTAAPWTVDSSGKPVSLSGKPINLPPVWAKAGLETAKLATATELTPSVQGPASAAAPALTANVAANAVLAGHTIVETPVAAKQVDLSKPLSSISDPWLAAATAVAVKAHIEAAPAETASIVSRMKGLKTLGDLAQYHSEVTPIISNAQAAARQQRVSARKLQVQKLATGIAPAASAAG